MKKNKIYHLIEYLSPTTILSYFYIHNIFLVLIGISLSLYLINIDFFNRIMRSINNHLVTRKLSKKLNKSDSSKKIVSYNIKSRNEYSTLSLVEKIEELGYIPSIDKNEKGNAA